MCMKKNNKKEQEVIEMLQHIVAHMVTKDEFNDRFDSLENRVGGLENSVDSLENSVDSLENRMIGIENRLTTIEDIIVTKDEFNDRVNTIYNLLDRDLKKATDNEMETAAVHHKLDRHDEWFTALETKCKLSFK